MALLSDINATGKWLIEQSPDGHCGEEVNYQLADTETRLQSPDSELSSRPLSYGV